MKNISIKKLLDLLLYAGICLWAIASISTMIMSDIVIQWQHYLGLIFLSTNGYIFYRTHQGGILFLGLTLFLAMFGILSFNVGLLVYSSTWTPFGLRIPLFWGNPTLLVLLIIHFIISGRYYVGILSKQYWNTFRESLK